MSARSSSRPAPPPVRGRTRGTTGADVVVAGGAASTTMVVVVDVPSTTGGAVVSGAAVVVDVVVVLAAVVVVVVVLVVVGTMFRYWKTSGSLRDRSPSATEKWMHPLSRSSNAHSGVSASHTS